MVYVKLAELSEIVSYHIRSQNITMERSIYPLLEVARSDDYDEMLWNVLRILNIIGVKDEDLLDSISRTQGDSSLIRQYLYAIIIGIMMSSASRKQEVTR
jgi:hypothetical protein